MSKYYTDPTTGQRVTIQKTHKFRNFVVFPATGFLAFGLILSAAGGSGSGTAPSGPAPAAESSTTSNGVSTLEVTGDGQAMVGIMSGGHSMNTVTLPKTQQLPEGFVSTTASRTPNVASFQNGGSGDSGTITCTITRDGKVVDTQTASGQFASVSCSKSY